MPALLFFAVVLFLAGRRGASATAAPVYVDFIPGDEPAFYN